MLKNQENQKSHAPSLTALVVEDQKPNMNYILYLLDKMNISYIEASSGEEALKKIEGSRFDLMLLDINLGEKMSGIDLLQELRFIKQYESIPAVAVTAYYSGRKKQELIDNGFNGYVAKPFSQDDLRNAIKAFFGLDG